jgi:hypothetical protein
MRPGRLQGNRRRDAVVRELDERAGGGHHELFEAVAVERCQQEEAHADVELERLDVRGTRRRRRDGLLRHQEAGEPLAELAEREALCVATGRTGLAATEHEVHEGLNPGCADPRSAR